MPRLKLTDRFVRNVPPPSDGRGEYLDSVVPQLMLRVTPTGHKSFALLARFPGHRNPTRRLLGAYYDGDQVVLDQPDAGILDRDGAALSLAEAREKARIWLGMIARGRDPGAEKRAAQVHAKAKEAEAQLQAATTFERVAALWIKRKAAGLKHELEIESCIEREFTARWKGRPLADISREEMRLAVQEGYPFGDAVRLLALTGQRLREIADLSWDEIDLDGEALITIPKERMKGKAAHEVPLAPQALALLCGLPRFSSKYVFSLKGGVRTVGGFDRPKARLDAASGVTEWRLHDLRRTARSGF